MTMEAQQVAMAAGENGPREEDRPEGFLRRLEGLAEVVAGLGLQARLVTPPGRVPRLHVVNPAAPALAEDVYAARGRDGQWWFWWSWAERIGVSDDLAGAAGSIGRVLAAAE